MLAIVNSTDFTGVYVLDFNSNAGKVVNFDAFCLEIQELYLKMLLGDNLFYEFYALTTLTDSKFKELVEGKSELIEHQGNKLKYDGLKPMLKAFTFFHYLQSPDYNSVAGQVLMQAETATQVTNDSRLIRAYNDGVSKFELAQMYMDYYNEGKEGNALLNYQGINLEKTNCFGF